MRRRWLVLVLTAWAASACWPAAAAGPETPEQPPVLHPPTPLPANPPTVCPPADALLPEPVLREGLNPDLALELPADGETPLPINLAAALRLAGGRPLIIAAAQATVQIAVADLKLAKLQWLPNVYAGASGFLHDGGAQGTGGVLDINNRGELMAGAGLLAAVSTNDAIFQPLALKQVLRARESEVQAARNDALLTVAEAYFGVQQARGQLAGIKDTAEKARVLARKVALLGKALVPPIEADRVRTLLAELRQSEATAREDWSVASADLTQALRLNPTAVVVPVEPPYLQVTLLAPGIPVDDLIPVGLTNRPELAAQQAFVQATLIRLKQERLRPLMPSLILQGDGAPAAPSGFLMGGVFASDVDGKPNMTTAREDINVQLVWELRNLGFGNHALVQQRQAEQQRAVIELLRVQDRVAAEIARSHAQLVSAATRIGEAETDIREAIITYNGTVKGLSETYQAGQTLFLVNRPQEATAALRRLTSGYDNYFRAVNEYNRAQFRLYRALGYPAGVLECERTPGPAMPVDTCRPQMPQ